jgi:hypothetical protein
MLEIHMIFCAMFVLAGAFVGYCFFLECSSLLGLKDRTLVKATERARSRQVGYKVGAGPRL